MQKEWDEFWLPFLDAKKLITKVDEMNEMDGKPLVESICHSIFDKYDDYHSKLNKIRLEFVQEVEHLPGVHLQTSRVKSLESILEKVINKRYRNLFNSSSLYSSISRENFGNILTDLVGVRLIISYRGEWAELHNEIIKKFPYMDEKEYMDNKFIPHVEGRSFIAEIPHAYYAYGDDISMYNDAMVSTKMKDTGYRSVHYVISFHGVYIELQTRTIFDEAWSDCDHSYVYKHDENKSHASLSELSKILCQFTNSSNDLGDLMHKLYYGSYIVDNGKGSYVVTDENILSELNHIVERYKMAQKDFEDFLNRVQVEVV